MKKKSAKEHTDINLLAKSIVSQATGEESVTQAQQAARLLGRLGGLKGGKIRAERLSESRRSEIARNAAAVRWRDYQK